MPTVLIIDDSRSVRSIVGDTLRELGFEITQAEDGEQGLALLSARKVDLILLDITMPVMDGPTMLKALRERGDHTPVIMLTGESKRSTIAGALRLGIEDYLLKPCKPDELKHKISRVMKLDATQSGASPVPAPVAPPPPAPAPVPVPAPVPAAGATAATAPARRRTDVLLVDDMENVHRKLREVLPDPLTLHGATDARDALARCQASVYRLVLLDLEIPEVDSLALLRQLRALQPDATFLALARRSAGDPSATVIAAGFAGHLFKPFDPEAIGALVVRMFEIHDLLEVEGDLIVVKKDDARDDRLDRHHARLRPAVEAVLADLAAACQDAVILDVRHLPLRAERTLRLIIDVDRDARRLGLGLRLVCAAELASLLRRVADTADVPVFDTVESARGSTRPVR
ncbi:MAG TPA: response regulator [Kofleriaceae bacterium]|nr:response regulator [Kofleriaceae bacterium]